MAKPKAPFFSFEAHGTIADSITTQKRHGSHFTREKPVPSYRRTLLQQYQRWLYEDYVAYWNDQSVATKQTWETNARPHHMTGFAYWMQYHLKNMPDIVGAWHLDFITGNTVYDSSTHSNHGTLFGPSLVPGIIDNALSFDGIDDYVSFPYDPSFQVVDAFTFELFFYFPTQKTQGLFMRGQDINTGNSFIWEIPWHTVRVILNQGWGTDDDRYGDTILTPGLTHHLAVTWSGTTKTLIFYLNGLPDGSFATSSSLLLDDSWGLFEGVRWTSYSQGIHDELRFYNRVLTPSDILRHSLRRYPS